MDVEGAVTRLPVVQRLPQDVRARVVAASQVTKLRAGELLWDRGEGAACFTFVVDGQVRLLAEHQEGSVLVDLVDTGSLVCGSVVCGAAPYCCRAVCTRDTELLTIPREVLMSEVLSPVGALLSNQNARRAMTLCRRLREVGGSKVRHRVAAVLIRLADDRGTAHEGRVRLPDISRRDLAGLAGCATETLIRELSRLEQVGAVSRDGRSLVVDVVALTDQGHDGHDADPE